VRTGTAIGGFGDWIITCPLKVLQLVLPLGYSEAHSLSANQSPVSFLRLPVSSFSLPHSYLLRPIQFVFQRENHRGASHSPPALAVSRSWAPLPLSRFQHEERYVSPHPPTLANIYNPLTSTRPLACRQHLPARPWISEPTLNRMNNLRGIHEAAFFPPYISSSHTLTDARPVPHRQSTSPSSESHSRFSVESGRIVRVQTS
jgi:hypothetical protein